MVEIANKKIDYVGQLEFPRVCLIGNTGTGKSALANAICGKELFRVSESFDSCTSEVKQEQARWEGKGKSFYIVDTCGFGDSKDGDETQMNEFVARLKGFFYVNLFVLVFNGQSPRFDKLIQDMLKAFKQILGERVFQHVCVVFTRWDYDPKSLRDRKKKNLTEEFREKEFNQHLKEKIQINTDKYPIKCFFVDSSSFVDPENDDENALARLRDEFDKLKETCLSSKRFLCVDLKEYESGKKKLEEGQLELQKIEYEKRLLEEKFKNEKKILEIFAKIEKSQFIERYKRQKAIVNKIEEYFGYRPDIPKDSTPLKCFGMISKGTLYRDVAQILIDFNKKDDENRYLQKKYENILVAELNSCLPKLIEEKVIKIIHDEFKEFVRDCPMLPNDILITSPEDMKLDITSMVGEAIATSVVLTAASMGLIIGGAAGLAGLAALEGGAILAGGLAALAIGSLAALTGGAILIIAIPFAIIGMWSRDDVLNGLIPAASQSYSQNKEFKDHLKSFAEKAFDIAADKYYNKIAKAIAPPE